MPISPSSLLQMMPRGMLLALSASLSVHADVGARAPVRWDEMRASTQIHAIDAGEIKATALFGPELEDGTRQAIIDLKPTGKVIVTARTKPDEEGNIRLETTGIVTGASATRLTVDKLSVELPLSLANRKRVVQAGEKGLTWETRSVYQFHAEEPGGQLLPEPDTNIWSIFRSDWTAADTYSLQRWESAATGPFALHRGRGFPGWMAVYDREGGVVIAVDEPDYTTPRSLEVRTEGGGTACFDLQPVSADPGSAQAGTPIHYEAHWKLRTFEGALADNGTRLSRNPSIEEPKAALAVAPSKMLPVFGGVPVSQGQLQAGEQVVLNDEAGRPVEAQTAPLAYWPDGSVKWLELVFLRKGIEPRALVKSQQEDAGVAAFQVTYGTGAKESFTVHKRRAVTAAEDATLPGALSVTREANAIRVRTGNIEAMLAPGKDWWKALSVGGRSLLAGDTPAAAYVDTLVSDTPLEPGARSPRQGTRERALLVADNVTAEENGPVRAVVRIDGHTAGPAPCRITLRLEFYAGSAAIRGYYTLELGNFDVRRVFISGFGLELPLTTGRKDARVLIPSLAGEPVEVPVGDGVALHALHPDVCELLTKSGEATQEIAVNGEMAGMISVRDNDGRGLVAGIRDLRHLFPTEIALKPQAGRWVLDLAFWPQSGGVMDFRRYSDFPHWAQGETITSDKNDWVESVYYNQEPVSGISCTHEFLLVPGAASAGETAALEASLDDRPLIYSGEKEYLRTGVLAEDLTAAGFAPVRETLERFADFLEFHRERYRWYGKWIYGDIQHRFGQGYGRIVPAGELAGLLRENKQAVPPRTALRDYFPNNDWASDNGRWGWSNTEGLPNRYLGELYLRTGRRDVFFEMEALARHSRDVVIRHSGRWYGNGTRHGVQPWSDGDHEQRQTIPSEYRLDRLLTGDKRSRDVLLDYGYNVYLKPVSNLMRPGGIIQYHADHSARLYGLLTLWEATGDPAVGKALGRYVDQFIVPEGIAISPQVRFPQIESAAPPEGINSGNMFFNSFGGMQALVEYYRLTHDEPLRQAICRMAASALDTPATRASLDQGALNSKNFYWLSLAFAARHADQPERFRAFLQDWLRGPGWRDVHELVSRNPAHWTGASAFMPEHMAETLFWLNALPYVAETAGPLPPLTTGQEAELRQLEAKGMPHVLRTGSWQDDYDAPVFEHYLGRWLPWTTTP